jgi:hypothetical protein
MVNYCWRYFAFVQFNGIHAGLLKPAKLRCCTVQLRCKIPVGRELCVHSLILSHCFHRRPRSETGLVSGNVSRMVRNGAPGVELITLNDFLSSFKANKF